MSLPRSSWFPISSLLLLSLAVYVLLPFVPLLALHLLQLNIGLSVLKRCVLLKTLAFAFGLRLRSKTLYFKMRVLVRRLPNGKPEERLRFRDLRAKTLAFKRRIAMISCVLEASLGARACVQVLCVQKTRRFAFAFLNPLRYRLT